MALLLLCTLASCTFEQKTSEGITIEVAIFEGGYGVEWYKGVARQYEKLHPDIKVNLWGDPRVDEKLKPRILRGDPPEVANSLLPTWKLITAGKLYPLDQTLDSPAYGDTKTWRETLVPGVLSTFQYQGKSYAMPTDFGAWVVWYDRKLFRTHGWTVPKTWDEFLALCEKIKAANIAPIAFQGKYPIYAWATLLTLFQRIATPETWYAAQDIAPGAFSHPDFLRAAELLQQMATRYHESGAMAMTHTESQMEWVNRRAAMLFCGLWLPNEMKAAIPPDLEMDCFPVPTVAGGKGDNTAVYGGGGAQYFVFSQARHPEIGADFLKFMVSRQQARTYTETLGALSPVRNATAGVKMPPALQSAVMIVNRAESVFSDRITSLYLEFGNNTLPENLSALIQGKITPQQFGENLEKATETIRRDPNIYKPPALGVPRKQ